MKPGLSFRVAVALCVACGVSYAESTTPMPVPLKKAPQYFGAFLEAAPTAVEPQGWMKELLQRQVDGLGSHHSVSGYPFDTCLWAGPIPPTKNPKGKAWWPYEQTGYLVDGLERLGLVTGDKGVHREATANIEYILSHPGPDGSLGPTDIGPDNWPHAVVFRALMAAGAANRPSPAPSLPDQARRFRPQARRLQYRSHALGVRTDGRSGVAGAGPAHVRSV